ncbi:DUF305 domain-containing protein [Plantactinospora sonchi]|uniref:DUF305 domain-containing protein n=1 Tax=Plantactinospora sonchi TaxID=1544735 RepID=A0ABU7RUW4_9ACTN
MARWRRTALVVAMLTLGGCGSVPAAAPVGAPAAPPGPAPTSAAPGASTTSGSPGASAAFNAADVMFLQMMVTHHGQGLDLVRLVPDRARRTEVTVLAAAIEVTQRAEQETMRGWLRDWGRPTEADPNAHAHADHGGLPVTGPEQIAALGSKTGAEFETAFLNLLIGHQHGAVEMARTELRSGTYPEARELARRIELSRTAQIDQMLKLVGQAGSAG